MSLPAARALHLPHLPFTKSCRLQVAGDLPAPTLYHFEILCFIAVFFCINAVLAGCVHCIDAAETGGKTCLIGGLWALRAAAAELRLHGWAVKFKGSGE